MSPASFGFAYVDSGTRSGCTVSFGFVWVHEVVRKGRGFNSGSRAFNRERRRVALFIRVRSSTQLGRRFYPGSLGFIQRA